MPRHAKNLPAGERRFNRHSRTDLFLIALFLIIAAVLLTGVNLA